MIIFILEKGGGTMELRNIIETLYKLSMKNKSELKNKIEDYLYNCKIRDEEGRFIILHNGIIFKIAYNENGLFKNYHESNKNLDLTFTYKKEKHGYQEKTVLSKNHLSNFLKEKFFFSEYHSSIIDQKKLMEHFQSSYDNKKEIESKYFRIICENYLHHDEIYSRFDIYQNVSLYYILKKTLFELEKKSLVGNISIKDFKFNEGKVVFETIDNLYPFKKTYSKEFLTCPKCSKGFLRFDIEHFLEEQESDNFESNYNCSNSYCSHNLSFSEIVNDHNFSEEIKFYKDYKLQFDNVYSRESLRAKDFSNSHSYHEDDNDGYDAQYNRDFI